MNEDPTQELLQHLCAGTWADEGEAHRLFHGRGHCYPGLEWINVDHYGVFILITLYKEVSPEWLATLVEGLKNKGVSGNDICVLAQHRYSRQGKNNQSIEVLYGDMPDRPVAIERGYCYELNLTGQQNIGFFLDMAPGRHWLAERAEGRRVLNLFSYTCSFSVAALGAGALQVVNVDMSKAALAQGQRNHQRNGLGLASGAVYLPHNLFRVWKRLERYGKYDVAIVDPPSRQPGSFVAEKDYAYVLERLGDLMAPGAELLLCLNAPGLGETWFKDLVQSTVPAAQFVERLCNRADFPEHDNSRNLKMLVYRL